MSGVLMGGAVALVLKRCGLWLLLWPALLLWGQGDASVGFVHVSDTHVMELRGVHPALAAARRHYEASAQAFEKLLRQLARQTRPAFLLHTGDITDAYSLAGSGGQPVYGQVERFQRIEKRSPVRLLLALGNHDVHHYALAPGQKGAASDQSIAGQARAAWTRASDCFRQGTYYSFEQKVGSTRYVFLVLDNGYRGADPEPGALPDPAGFMISREQLHWLRRTVAANQGAIFILAMHVPLGEDAASQAIKRVFSDCPAVALVLTGHIHTPAIEEIAVGASRPVQLRSGAFAQSATNWRFIRLRQDAIEVSEVGQPQRVVRVIPAPMQARPTGAEREGAARQRPAMAR